MATTTRAQRSAAAKPDDQAPAEPTESAAADPRDAELAKLRAELARERKRNASPPTESRPPANTHTVVLANGESYGTYNPSATHHYGSDGRAWPVLTVIEGWTEPEDDEGPVDDDQGEV